MFYPLRPWRLALATLLLGLLLAMPAALAAATGEADVDGLYTDAGAISPWAREAIREGTEQGMIAGSGGKLRPQGLITRAEFTKLLVEMLAIEAANGRKLPFADVSKRDWFYPYVQIGYDAGMVSGYSSTAFRPHAPIARQEMAVMMVQALGLQEELVDGEPQDMADAALWAQPAVRTVAAVGIMQGDSGQFRPRDPATREMAFVVAMRAYAAAAGEEAAGGTPGGQERRLDEVRQLIRSNSAFMQRMVPEPGLGTLAGEWTMFGLARSGEPVPDDYYAAYERNVVAEVQRLMPESGGKAEGRLDRSKGTEHARLMLGLTAIGRDVHDVGGYDIRQALADFDYVTRQGINGPIFALIAFDSLDYEIPIDAGVKEQTTRARLIAFILEREIDGGGWALGADPVTPDPDMTAMAIQGLTPYYTERPEVRAAADRGLAWLAAAQDSSGGYRSWGALNAESAAQVVVALSGLGIDAAVDPRFVKQGGSVLDALLGYAAPDGGFYHIRTGEAGNGGAAPGAVDPMATDQAMYALVAYRRFAEGGNRLYDMTDRTGATATAAAFLTRR
ncbi:S-layer homology domain-containing protein [Paenibacillus sp. IB182496]|uniref:S-layer homology domain-containing protein n=1 Tax=Paenibacillus sabuli TaxID=2772509 RepID=A0A927BWB5_9BACL|nr:S-layer homology domain-containing protein [Paenibacillus sabuli]MBD2846835.1 S-layer homology domain-containing protein [Paenibacillus sabuli]